MALTIASVAAEPGPIFSLGDLKAVVVDITMDSSYLTAGELLDPVASLGLSTVVFMIPTFAVTTSRTTSIQVHFDTTNNKLLAYWGNAGSASVIPEVTSTTDLSTFTARCVFFGK